MNMKKIRRKAKRWLRKHRLHLRVAGVLAVVVLVIAVAVHKDYDDFLDALGMRESSNDYTVVNRFGYMGRYQMGTLALQDAGFLDENGAWTPLANSYGIYSEYDFLHCPEGQDAAVRACHTKLCGYIRHYGLDAYIGKTYCGVKVTRSGLLAAGHLVGIGNLKEALATGQPVYDGNQVAASEYMELFAGYDVSRVWNPCEGTALLNFNNFLQKKS